MTRQDQQNTFYKRQNLACFDLGIDQLYNSYKLISSLCIVYLRHNTYNCTQSMQSILEIYHWHNCCTMWWRPTLFGQHCNLCNHTHLTVQDSRIVQQDMHHNWTIVQWEQIDLLVYIVCTRSMVGCFVLGRHHRCSPCRQSLLKRTLYLQGKIYTKGWRWCFVLGTCRCCKLSK